MRYHSFLAYAIIIVNLTVLLSCSDDKHSETTTPIQLSAVDLTFATRAGTTIQSSTFQSGEKINGYITNVETGETVGNNPIVYTAGTAQNGINPLIPDVQPYFPNGNTSVNVFALYPGTGDNAVSNGNTKFSVLATQTSDEQYRQSDLMHASVENQSKTGGTVNLGFSHKMAKLVISASGEDNITVNSIKLTNFYRTIGFTPSSGVLGDSGTLEDKGDIVLSNGGAVLVPPQTLTNTIFIVLGTSKGEAKFMIQDSKTFEAGKQYFINLVVGDGNFRDNYVAPITGWGDVGTISVAAAGSSGFTIGDISSYTYTGDSIKPTPVVNSGSKTLTRGTDYNLQYFDNTNVGTASVLVVGAGTYAGIAAVKTFNITQATGSLSYAQQSITIDYVKGATVSNTLTKTGDGTMTYSSSNTGVATVSAGGIVTMKGPGGPITITANMAGDKNYTAATATYQLTINRKAVTPGSLTVTLSQNSFVYTGNVRKPDVTVMDGNEELTENTDYTLTWPSDCTNAGTKTITITGIGGYSGTITKDYSITQATNNITMANTAIVLTVGSSQTRTASATFGSSNLKYTSSSTSIVSVGEKTGTITGVAVGGPVTITASVAATDNYTGVSATYQVTVIASAEKEFTYKGSVEEYVVPYTGTYKLEVWGAGGGKYTGNNNPDGGQGGYVYGKINLTAGTKLYVCVGGKGGGNSGKTAGAGGYNGGGTGGTGNTWNGGAGGGGATHIAMTTNRGVLKNYKSYSSEILIVAGGAGGASFNCYGGKGGGNDVGGLSGEPGEINEAKTKGVALSTTDAAYVAGGTTSSGNAFGEGQNGITGVGSSSTGNDDYGYQRGTGGGGGGYYGGKAHQHQGTYTKSNASGGGGSGYIKTSSFISGTTGWYTKQEGQTLTAVSSDGKAKITLVH